MFPSLTLALASACALTSTALAAPSCKSVSRVAVANRGSGTVSVIDVASRQVAATITLPAKGEPMYISVVDREMWVGDRGNDAVHVYTIPSYKLRRSIGTGKGVFHSMATQTNNGASTKRTTSVYVVNELDGTVSVISAATYRVRAQIKTPADIALGGGKPHDVTADRKTIWVTYLGFADKTGRVVAYDAQTFQETNRVQVGGDPHVAQRPKSGLFVASQDASKLTLFEKNGLTAKMSEDIPSAHGAFVSTRGQLYTTNIAGAGANAVWTFGALPNDALKPVSSPVSTTIPTPHNVVTDHDQTTLFVTHSGPTSDSVSVFPLIGGVPVQANAVVVKTGLNPFGLWSYEEKSCGQRY